MLKPLFSYAILQWLKKIFSKLQLFLFVGNISDHIILLFFCNTIILLRGPENKKEATEEVIAYFFFKENICYTEYTQEQNVSQWDNTNTSVLGMFCRFYFSLFFLKIFFLIACFGLFGFVLFFSLTGSIFKHPSSSQSRECQPVTLTSTVCNRGAAFSKCC